MKQSFRLLNTTYDRKFNDVVSLVAYVPRFLTPEECNRVVEVADSVPSMEGMTGTDYEAKSDAARDYDSLDYPAKL